MPFVYNYDEDQPVTISTQIEEFDQGIWGSFPLVLRQTAPHKDRQISIIVEVQLLRTKLSISYPSALD